VNKYILNFLRLLTKGQIPRKILKTAYDFKVKDNKLSFKVKAKINSKDWRIYYGSIKQNKKNP